jgi:uncharacterized delta-60 repeat protein
VLDTTFSADGKNRTDFAGGTDEGFGLAIQANGRILVGGSASPPNRDSDFDFGLVRYRASGKLDLTFSGDGKQRIQFGSNHEDPAYDLALAPDGKIVMAGWTSLTRSTGTTSAWRASSPSGEGQASATLRKGPPHPQQSSAE